MSAAPGKIPPRLLYSVPETAILLGVSENMVWNLLQRRELTGVKVGRSRKIACAEIQRYVAALADAGAS